MEKLFERIFVESLKDDMDKYEKDAERFTSKYKHLDSVFGYSTFNSWAVIGETILSLDGHELIVELSFDGSNHKPEDRKINNTCYTFYKQGEPAWFNPKGYNDCCNNNECKYDDFTEDDLIEHIRHVYPDIKDEEIETYLDKAMKQIEDMTKKAWEKWKYKIKAYPKRASNVDRIATKRYQDFDNKLSNLRSRFFMENPFVPGVKVKDINDPHEFWVVDDIDEKKDIVYLRAPEQGVERWIYVGSNGELPRKGTIFEDGQKVIKTSRADDYNDAAYLLRAEPGTIIKRKLSDVEDGYYKKPVDFNLKDAREYYTT